VGEPGPVVFVVDDDPSVRRAIESLLASVGLSVKLYESARDFLARAPIDAPACLVLDVRLPEADGLDLQQQLAESEPDLPIVFISGHGDIPMSVRAMKAGAVEFLPKPFQEHELLGAIEQALQRARMHRAARSKLEGLRARFESVTRREREVLTLVVMGMPNKLIASELGISEVTVKIHRGQVMQKMRADSVAALVRMSERLKLDVPPSSPTNNT
jgi:FixJ family two-component response regulator